MDDDSNAKKKHRKRLAGPKAEKQKKKNPHIQELTAKQRNPKAFAYQSIKKVERAVRRTADVKEKKHHLPVVDRSSLTPPPVIIAVVGPPKVGKTTLIKCLVRNFIKQKMSNICGPITIVSSKKQRLTFIECNNDINSMIDLAKIADLVLLLVDASFGFEMEIFEFLHICKVHGEPKVIGVLTHLDVFSNNKKLKKTKKTLKNRFWKDVYPGAKLFYLSGMVNEEYQKTEIHNLGRFISVMKYRPLIWKSTHPFVFCDRMEDITDPEEIRINEKCDRIISCYGYVRGNNFRNFTSIHLPGAGDFVIKDMDLVSDPCPLPSQIKKRSLNEKERSIYAPMCGVGGVLYDRDAIYIDIKGSHNLKDDELRNDLSSKLISNLQKAKTTIDNKMSSTLHLKLFIDENQHGDDKDYDNENDDDNDDDEDDDDENNINAPKLPWEQSINDDEEEENDNDLNYQNRKRKSNVDHCVKKKKPKLMEENDEYDDVDDIDDDDDDDEAISNKWKEDLKQKGILSFLKRLNSVKNMQKFVYEYIEKDGDEDGEREELVSGLLQVSKSSKEIIFNNKETIRDLQVVKLLGNNQFIDEIQLRVQNLFIKGNFGEEEDAEKILDRDDKLKSSAMKKDEFSDDYDDDNEEENDDEDDDGEDKNENNGYSQIKDEAIEDDYTKETAKERRERRMKEKLLERKRRLKEMFDTEYDDAVDADGNHNDKNHFEMLKDEMNQQGQLNRSAFEDLDEETRTNLEGFRPGLYVRIRIEKMAFEFVKYFDPNYPLIIGGLLPSEQNIGYVTANIKKHRWHKRILKTKDPIILSMGWRRFQTIPVYSIQDHNGRHRQIKYSPAHLHCMATFWGPITPQGTGIVCIQTTSSATREFRISAIGAVCELDKAFTVVKKLKLIGTPLLIHRNTAFIQGMFNSSLEVAKFESASIRTVGGIRGQVKKSIKNGATLLKKSGPLKQAPPPGTFRATFEDKILMSDIVFMRTWCKSEIPQLYNPVSTLLQPPIERQAWKGMKTLGELKRERGIRFNPNQDSLYKAIVRKELEAAPLVVPRKLQSQLPFKDKPKIIDSQKQAKRVAVIQEPKERQIGAMMKRMHKLYEMQRKQKRVDMRIRAQYHNQQQAKPRGHRK